MTWTYTNTLLTSRDKIRLYIGDIDTNAQLFSDEEIAGALTIYGTPILTAAALADGLAAKYSRSVTFAVEGLRIENSTKAEAYRKLGATLRARAASEPGGLGTPFIGGISDAEMDAVDEDTDRTPSRFKMDMHDNGGTNNLALETE